MKSISQGTLAAATLADREEQDLHSLPQSELDWLEATFAAYNLFHGYARRLPHRTALQHLPPPQFEGTSRHWYLSELYRLRRLEWER